jgi:catechol 2,3-dioxygenase
LRRFATRPHGGTTIGWDKLNPSLPPRVIHRAAAGARRERAAVPGSHGLSVFKKYLSHVTPHNWLLQNDHRPKPLDPGGLFAPRTCAIIDGMKPLDPRTEIGHVHLKVSDLERAVAFYTNALGFEVVQRMGTSAAFLSAGGYHHHIGLNTWESERGAAPPPDATGLYHFAIRYPDRASLGEALRRLRDSSVPLEGASDHGVSEALYLRDPDGNGIELYWDRPRSEWPRGPDGALRMVTDRLDLRELLAAADAAAKEPERPPSAYALMTEQNRERLRELRAKLLQLHKVLLDDARASYEMDRGRVPSNASLLQLVINDPWFAWLHSLSELVVRIDETIDTDSPATDADAAALINEVEKLLTASENGEGFHRRYYDALQRQPAVVLAHADVRRVIKSMR